MGITKFDRKVCAKLAPEVVAELEDLGKRYGLTIVAKGGVFSDTAYTIKVELGVLETAGGISREQADFNTHCGMYYCKPEDYGKELTINREVVSLIGFAPSRTKYCIRVRKMNGETALFSENVLSKIGRGWEAHLKAVEPTVTELTPGELPKSLSRS